MENGWMIAGLAAVGGLLASTWSYAQALISRLTSVVVIRTDLAYLASRAVTRYLRDHYKRSRYGHYSFIGTSYYVRPLQRWAAVGQEDIASTGFVYWDGWNPLWLKEGGSPANGSHAVDDAGMYKNVEKTQLITLRGVVDVEKLVTDAIDYYNSLCEQHNEWIGYRVTHVTGTAGRNMAPAQASYGGNSGRSQIKTIQGQRYLKWKNTDVGNFSGELGILNSLALDDKSKGILDSVKNWYKSKREYQKRGVPWRWGCCLYGPPGSGKTCIAQAIAEELNLQVYAFDLSSLTNDEFSTEWDAMLANTPCMALFEDLDNVYHGRELVKLGPSFDVFINRIDGIQRAQGLIVMATTNDISKLDPALLRFGRFGNTLEMGNMSVAAKREILAKMLPDDSQEWEAILSSSPNTEVAAAFVSKIIERAAKNLERQ